MSTRLEKPMVTVAYRIPEELRQFYEDIAEREKRDLSDVLRIATEAHAEVIKKRGGKLLPA